MPATVAHVSQNGLDTTVKRMLMNLSHHRLVWMEEPALWANRTAIAHSCAGNRTRVCLPISQNSYEL